MKTAIRKNLGTGEIFIHLFFIIMSISFIIPMAAIISISLSNEFDIVEYGYRLMPIAFDLSAYRFILRSPQTILNAYKVTIIITVAGTLIYLLIASMCAYALSRTGFKYRRIITFYLFFTMLFNGGLVPDYILMTRYLNLKNTYAALIIPILRNVWYLFLMRTFFQQIPSSIIESAKIDGAGEFRTYWNIIIPLSKPVLATVGLLQSLDFWNSWYNALLYITDKNLYPLQYVLQVMLRNVQEILRNMQSGAAMLSMDIANIPTESTRMAMCVLAVGPMLFVFPFFQKYFVKGLTVGSMKE